MSEVKTGLSDHQDTVSVSMYDWGCWQLQGAFRGCGMCCISRPCQVEWGWGGFFRIHFHRTLPTAVLL